MVEKALMIALVVGGLLFAASEIATRFHHTVDRVQCGFDQAQTCVIDDAPEK